MSLTFWFIPLPTIYHICGADSIAENLMQHHCGQRRTTGARHETAPSINTSSRVLTLANIPIARASSDSRAIDGRMPDLLYESRSTGDQQEIQHNKLVAFALEAVRDSPSYGNLFAVASRAPVY